MSDKAVLWDRFVMQSKDACCGMLLLPCTGHYTLRRLGQNNQHSLVFRVRISVRKPALLTFIRGFSQAIHLNRGLIWAFLHLSNSHSQITLPFEASQRKNLKNRHYINQQFLSNFLTSQSYRYMGLFISPRKPKCERTFCSPTPRHSDISISNLFFSREI